MEEFMYYLRCRGAISANFLNSLREKICHTRHTKGNTLLKAGQISDRIWFLKTGVLRWQYQDVITWFNVSGSLVYPAQSFNAQTPSRESIIAAVPSETWSIPRKVLYEFYGKFPETVVLERTIKDELQEQLKEHSFFKSNPSLRERFQYLQQQFPELLYQVPDIYLASFLNMSERSFRKLKNTRK